MASPTLWIPGKSMHLKYGNSIKNPLASQKHAYNVADGTIISRYENSSVLSDRPVWIRGQLNNN